MKTIRTIICIAILAQCLYSCSANGKIEIRPTSEGCLYIPDALFRDPNLIDTAGPLDEEYMNTIFVSEPKLRTLYQNRETLVQNSKSAYLINTSSDEVLNFTVRTTANDSLRTTSTRVIKLNPGQESEIGCEAFLNEKFEIVKVSYEIVGSTKKP